MADERFVMGLFLKEGDAAAAVSAMSDGPWCVERVHSPIPSDQIAGAMKSRKSRVGYFTLAGGIVGFIFGFLLAIFTATRWNIIVGGKPIVALIPFFIVGFEFTILFAVFGNVAGMLTLTGMPNWKADRYYDRRCSGEHFCVLGSCPAADQRHLIDFFKSHGGDVREYDG